MVTTHTKGALGALVVLALSSAAAREARAEAASEPVMVDGEGASEWTATRLSKAQSKVREIVRIPIAAQSLGWGCVCPEHYVGVDSVSNPGGAWLELSWDKHVKAPPQGRDGFALVAEGYFTGKTSSFRWEESDGELVEEYRLLHFHVLRARPLSFDRDADHELRVVLAGPEAAREVAPFGDDRPWLVMAASVPIGSEASERRAEKVRQRLVKAGFSAAEVFDSRRAPLLFCCYRVVVAGRFKTRDEARAASKAVGRKSGIKAYVRKGW